VITWATFLVGVTAAFAQKPAPPVTLSDTEQRAITSSKTGSRYDLFISLPAFTGFTARPNGQVPVRGG
jgi:hypothetical protein